MRRSALFCETLREAPADSEFSGHQLLLRGGFVQPLAAGIFSFLPLGLRVKRKVEQILHDEMEAIGGQEILMPLVLPAELWQESGRWQSVGAELARLRDRGGRDLLLAMTHEEAMCDLLRKQVRSYRQLPVLLYQIQTKFRDEPRARGGLIRLREFTMKDAYSADTDVAGLDTAYARVYAAYERIFQRVGLPVTAVGADVGMMGGSAAHEFMFLSPAGEDTIVLCDTCGAAANQQIALFQKEAPEGEEPLPPELVETPGTTTIASLAALLDVPASRTAKAAFFKAGDRLLFAVVRGDMDVNETKLARAAGATDLRLALPEELEGTGIVPGYASPIGVHGVTVIVDDLVMQSPNLVAGANRTGFHLRNTNVPRDYRPDIVADIAKAFEGAPCPTCGEPLRLARAVEVANTFKLGTRYSAALGAKFLGDDGKLTDIVMGSYGIGVDRLIACLAEAHRDEYGLIWPPAVAPYDVYLAGLDLGLAPVRLAAEALEQSLEGMGIEVLYDDRDERAGVKFKDADLLGIPLRVTVSRRTVERGAVEIKARGTGEAHDAPLDNAASAISEQIAALRRR